MNKQLIIGRLGADPELRYTQNNTAVANFSVATSTKWKDDKGEKQEKTEWHRCVSWGRLAEVCGEYLKKGMQIYIEGQTETRSWTDKEGLTRYTTEVKVQSMEMLSDAPEQPEPKQEPKPKSKPSSDIQLDDADPDDGDDLPF